MRLPITNKFLWDLYNGIDGVQRVYSAMRPPQSMYEGVYRETFHLKREYERRKARRSFSQFMHYMQKQGYVKMKTLEGAKGVMLTPKGVEKALKVRRKAIDKKKRKDGKWIMIIFDI